MGKKESFELISFLLVVKTSHVINLKYNKASNDEVECRS